MLAPTQHLLAVDEHVDHAGGVAVRVGVGRVVGDLLRVERDDVSEISARYAAAPETLCLADDLLANADAGLPLRRRVADFADDLRRVVAVRCG